MNYDKKKKLEQLRVSSFVTDIKGIKAGLREVDISIKDPNDPTANTWCYVCPEEVPQF
ncbi:pinensin family lanthipeptide [Roseivirga sp. BDSF3-8]|uniref:pinensin family lanthipeptide n=1 Tax=Roseivirga sp. BDSF3-8 TaxID=3241598 RepID=UPI0035322DD8